MVSLVSVDEIISRLNYFGGIKENHKMQTCDKTYINGNSWLGAAKRAWYGENRSSDISYITTTINQTQIYLENSMYSHRHEEILKVLVAARTGIRNLLKTYTNDPIAVGSVQYNLSCIEKMLEVNNHKESDKTTTDDQQTTDINSTNEKQPDNRSTSPLNTETNDGHASDSGSNMSISPISSDDSSSKSIPVKKIPGTPGAPKKKNRRSNVNSVAGAGKNRPGLPRGKH